MYCVPLFSKALLIFLGIAGIAVFAAGAMGMSDLYVSGTWRYKMTVVVETPEGIKTGSAVREVQAKRQRSILTSIGEITKTFVIGEAVIVDLGERGVLFKLMDIDGSHGVVYEAFPFPDGAPLTPEGVQYYDSLYEKVGDQKFSLERRSDHYPGFATFTDLNDPKSVKGVHPDKLDEHFGEGVRIKEIFVQMTDEQVTDIMMRWLPWLASRKGVQGYLGGESSPPFKDPTKTYLTGTKFRRGMPWSIPEENKK